MDNTGVSSKQTTVLTNGIIVGAGITIFVASLIGVYALNTSYTSLSSYLSSNGLTAIAIQLKLTDIIQLLSLCPVGFVFGSWLMALGLLSQFSKRARFAYAKKDGLTRLANGLMVGGTVFAALLGGDFFRQFYEPAFPFYEPFAVGTVFGIIILLVGFFLLLIRKPNSGDFVLSRSR